MANNGPPERDMKDFEFIQLCKFSVLPSDNEIPLQRGKLLACSSQCGLLIYATKQGFRTVETSQLMAIDEKLGKERNKVTIKDIPIDTDVDLSCQVLWIDVSGDGLYLAVVVKDVGQISILFYDIRSFANKNSTPVPFAKAGVNGASNISVLDLSWNPTAFSMLAVCTSDGAVKLIDVADSPKVIATLPAATGASCFCWSPKGKQLLVGKRDGNLAQYDHALAEKKQWPCPSILNGPHGVVDIVWQSTHVFLAAYLPIGAQPSDQPVVILTSSNKENNTSYINFEDVCFGNGEDRKAQYFFHLVLKWEMILMASGNATETTVVGKNLDDKTTWEHWNLEDCSRAELPLTADQNDSFPLGMAVDYSPQKGVVISESKRLPPCPVMYLLSTDGMLLGYHLSYTHKDVPQITTPAQMLNPSGARKGVPELAPGQSAQTSKSQPPQLSQGATVPTVVTSAPLKPPVQAPTTTASPSLTTPIAAGQNPTQQAFSGFGASALNTSGPSFQFAALGAAGAPPPGGLFSQKPQAFQTSASVSQPGSSQLPFGVKTPVSSAFSFSGTPTTNQSAASAFVAPPIAHSKPLPQTQHKAAGFEADHPKPVVSEQHLSGPAVPPPGVPPKDGVSAGVKNSPQTLGAGTQPAGIFGFNQPRATTPSAFTARPTLQGQGQIGQILQTPQTPGNGLVLNSGQPFGSSAFSSSPGNGLVLNSGPNFGSSAFSSSPSGPQPVQPRAPKPFPSQAPQIRNQNPPDVQPPTLLESQKSIEARLDSAFTQNIIEEIMDFERELKDLKSRSKRDVRTVGTRDEMYSLRQDTEKMVNFCKEIKEATKEQLREVKDQKSLCFNLFAMAEDCKTKQMRNSDTHYHSLLQGRALDPASAEKLKGLQQMAQALEQNVVEVDRVLDAQWQEHVAEKRKEERLHTPTGDTIYKSIKNNHIVIASQHQQLEKVEEQLRNLKLYSKLSDKGTQPFSLFSGDRTASPSNQKKPETTLTSAVTNGMTPEKISRLRDVLSQRKVPRIKSTAPANLSMSRIISLSPIKTPATPATPKQEHHQLQQRKHTLQQPNQTPTGPPPSQYGLQTGQLRFQRAPGGSGPLHPEGLNQQPQPQLLTPQAKAQPVPSGQRMIARAPTSFSGVAYFKQPSPVGAVTKPTVMLGSGPKPEIMLSHNVASPNTNPVHAPQLSNQAASMLPGVSSHDLQQHLYEDITPTETDDDDDDDYDDEDNGYEEEEEEDEEEAGFPGIDGQSSGLRPNTAAGQVSVLGQMMSATSPKSPQNQNQLGMQSGSFGSSGSSGAFSFTNPGNMTSGGLFKLSQTSSLAGSNSQESAQDPSIAKPGGNGFSFSAPKLDGASTTGVFSFSKTMQPASDIIPSLGQQTASGEGIPPSGANQKPEAGTGFKFGGAAVFNSRLDVTASTTGSLTTSSKSVEFGNLSVQDGKSSDVEEQNSKGGVSSTAGFSFGSSTSGPSFGSLLPTTLAMPKPSVTQATAAPQATTKQVTTADSTTGTTHAVSSGTDTSASTSTPVIQGASFGITASTTGITTPAQTSSVFSIKTTPTNTPGTQSVGSSTPSSTPSSSNTVVTVTPVTTAPSLFGGIPASAATTLFGGTSSSSTPLFGGNATTASPFGSTTTQATATPFGSGTSTAASVFGGAATSTTSAPLFGSATSTSTPSTTPSSLFGSATTTTSSTTPAPLFGSATTASATSTTPAPLFGSATTTSTPSTTPAPLFGSATTTSTPSTTPAPLFGSATSTSTPSTTPSSLFGSATTTTSSTTPAPLFGSATTTSAPSTTPAPLFGSATTAATSTTPSLFGSATTTTSSTTAAPLFGSATATSAPITTPATPFGGVATTTSSTTPAPLFGSASTTSTSVFGFGTAPGATASGGLFGASSTTTSGGSVFGGGSGGGLFGSSNTTTASTGAASVFGSGAATVFGSSTTTSQQGSVFGQPSTSSGFGFGQQAVSTTAATPFGQTSTFGQAPASSSTGLFGFGGLGGKPSEEKAKQNVFGTPQVFGGTTSQSSNLFGSGSSNTFGGAQSSPSFSDTNNAGGFSGGSGGRVGSLGFGVTSSGQSPGGFGAAPTFGSSPGFGTSAGFGGKPAGFGTSPAFGGTPAFGSSPSFSSPSGSTSTFGSANAGFSSFASAPAPSFGQLAQSTPSTSAFGGGGFGSTQQAQSSAFGAGFGSSQPSFGGGSVFGGQGSSSPGFGSGGQSQAFGNSASSSSSFGSNPAFSSYRG